MGTHTTVSIVRSALNSVTKRPKTTIVTESRTNVRTRNGIRRPCFARTCFLDGKVILLQEEQEGTIIIEGSPNLGISRQLEIDPRDP